MIEYSAGSEYGKYYSSNGIHWKNFYFASTKSKSIRFNKVGTFSVYARAYSYDSRPINQKTEAHDAYSPRITITVLPK